MFSCNELRVKAFISSKPRNKGKTVEAHKFPIGHTNRMPHIISQTQDDSHDELRDKPYPVEKTNFCKVKSNFGLAWKNQSSLVTVKSHLRTMPRSKKKKRGIPNIALLISSISEQWTSLPSERYLVFSVLRTKL